MQIELFQWPDKSDPFNQRITLAASEVINGKRYANAVALSPMGGLEQLAPAVQRLWEGFEQNPETRGLLRLEELYQAVGKLLLRNSFGGLSQGQELLWRKFVTEEMEKEDRKPVLPKDLLTDLEKMDEKRMLEHLLVAV